jgi:hypothetical protein
VNPVAPPGFVEIARPNVKLVAREDLADALVHITEQGTVYDWASKQPGVTQMEGRLPVYVTRLPPNGAEVVVRRNHHGGMLASLRGDRFLAIAAIPRELLLARVLAQTIGIPTPEVVAQISYRINALERRVDVVTLRLPLGEDLGAALMRNETNDARAPLWSAVDLLLNALEERGIWHQDLNVKNIYLIHADPPAPVLLDIDRVQFHHAGPLVGRANRARLVRSLQKWRATRGAVISDDEIAQVGTRKASS